MKKTFKEKLTSRKFLAALSGVLIGLGVLVSGETVEGTVTILTSILGYLIAEGYVDGKAVKDGAEAISDVADGVSQSLTK